MAKVKVTCNMLDLGGMYYLRGSIAEVKDEEAFEIERDRNGEIVDDKLEASPGMPKAIDAVERAVREKNFKEAREAGGIVIPDPALDPKNRDAEGRLISPVVIPRKELDRIAEESRQPLTGA